MERERARQQATANALRRGGTNADILMRLQQVAPLAGLALKERFAQQDRAEAGEQRAKEKHQLSKWLSDLDFVARKAAPLDAFEKKGADRETLQVMYADALEWLDSKGVDVSRLPKQYTPGYAAIAIAESMPLKDQLSLRLRQAELEERQEPTPGVHVPFPPKVEAQKRRLARATRPPARDIRNREAAMIEETATDYLTEANGDPDEALALLEEELRLPNASAEFRRLASKIRNRTRERVRPGRSRRSTEGDRLQEILGPLEQ